MEDLRSIAPDFYTFLGRFGNVEFREDKEYVPDPRERSRSKSYDVYLNEEKIGEIQAFDDSWVRRYQGRVPGVLVSIGKLPDPNREEICLSLAKFRQMDAYREANK